MSGELAPYRLDLQPIREGLAIMARDFPEAFGRMQEGRGDARTGDLLVQCAVFGDLIYG